MSPPATVSPNLMQIYTTLQKLMSTFTQRAHSAEKSEEDASKQKHNQKGKNGAVGGGGGVGQEDGGSQHMVNLHTPKAVSHGKPAHTQSCITW